MSYAGCPCYWLEPTGRVQISLRRFTHTPPHEPYAKICPAAGDSNVGCNASTALDLYLPLQIEHGEYGPTMDVVPEEHRPPRDDPRWPQVCMRHPGGEQNAGALLDAWWLHERVYVPDGLGYVGSDGIALIAICPNGLAWDVDGPASSGGRWTRTGDPRQPATLTVSPSIAIGKSSAPWHYHGHLQNGAFTAG